MKILRLAVLAALLCGPRAPAAESRYDVLAKLLTPFISVFARATTSPNRALTLGARIERLTDLPPELAGAGAEVALQYPDKLRLAAPILGERVIVCRNGQQLWVSPGAKIAALIESAAAAGKLPKRDPTFRLEPFRLPIPEKQLVFLPALFVVRDAGIESVDGEDCRVLDLGLMPELARSLSDPSWSARVWVRPNYQPARLVLKRTAWELAVKFEKVDFQPRLADATWQPPPDAGADVLAIDAPRFQQLLRAVVR